MRSGSWSVQALRGEAPAPTMAPTATQSPLFDTRMHLDGLKANGKAGQAPALQGLRVLVVDDEAPVRTSMQTLLTSWGCEVQTAEGLDDALAYLHQGFALQLLITDYRLRAGTTGGDVIAAMRTLNPLLPAIIVTGDTDPERIREAAGHGATLLHKPVSIATLREAMLALRVL
ncbi:MAG: response regulator [Brachymonas sp.]|nr:response regulator [Brachymonas sp.]